MIKPSQIRDKKQNQLNYYKYGIIFANFFSTTSKLHLFCKDYDFNILLLLYLISTGETLPHLPPLTARPCLFSGKAKEIY